MVIAEERLLSTARRVAVALDDHPVLFKTATLPIRAVRKPVRRREINTYLATHERRMLAIGSGLRTRPGWLSVDYVPLKSRVVFMDATKPFPLPTGSFDFIHSEHMIEHIPYEAGAHMVGECRRVLRDGGVLRLATPDLRRIVRLLDEEDDPQSSAYIEWSNERYGKPSGSQEATNACFVVNRMMRMWGHTFIYDEDTMTALLGKAGFSRVERVAPGQSSHPELAGIEEHHNVIGEAFNQIETVVFEATA